MADNYYKHGLVFCFTHSSTFLLNAGFAVNHVNLCELTRLSDVMIKEMTHSLVGLIKTCVSTGIHNVCTAQ